MIYKRWAQMEKLRPSELLEFTRNCPVVYVPVGIWEWHDAQDPMGTDTIKILEIARRAARITGGVVHMPVYTGVGAFYGPTSTLPHGGINFEEDFVREYALKLCEQLEKLGFRLVVLLYGHTNEGNINAYEGAAYEYMRRPDTSAGVLALNDVGPAVKHRYKCRDHAAKWETSFMMALCPEAVRMEEVDPAHGPWWGLDPVLHASAAEGERMLTLISAETAAIVEAAAGLPREDIAAANFAALSGRGSQPCWADCRNVEDLQSGYWKGDKLWEDPCCPFCAWRTPGVTRALAGIMGHSWMDELAARWSELLASGEFRYKQRDALAELAGEWESMK
jgi:creatinine amidohydrolase